MAGIIAKDTIEEVRFKSDIADVIGSYINLKKAGTTHKALCPFHKEKTPSFTVNIQRQIFHCFGCGAGGDVFSFVQQIEGVDFVTAVKLLAEKCGVRIELEEGSGKPGGPDKDRLFKLMKEVTKAYQSSLANSPKAEPARTYLANRKLDKESINAFMIGYAPKGWRDMSDWAKDQKFTEEQLEAAGMIIKSDDSQKGGYYDRFRDRIMFPIQDELGRVIGFSGRILESDSKAAKYINSPETVLFKKSHILYGLDKARQTMAQTREGLICEGQIDVIRCHAAGLTNAVAAQGTAFTTDHARILHRYCDKVTILFDSDKAGKEAAVKAGASFLQAGLVVTIANMPQGQDPDSYILEHGSEALKQLVANARSALDFQIDVMSEHEDLSSEAGLMKASKAIMTTINSSPNAVQRARLIQQAAERLNIPAGALEQERRHAARKQPKQREPEPVPLTRPDEPPLPEEKALVEHMASFPELSPLIESHLPLRFVRHPLCRRFVEAVMQAHTTSKELMSVVTDHDDDEKSLSRFAAKIQMAPQKLMSEEVDPGHALQDLILYIHRREIKHARNALRESSEPSSTDIQQKLREYTHDLKMLSNWETGEPVLEILCEQINDQNSTV